MAVLGNFVRLVPDTPVRMRLDNPRIEDRTIRDPKTGRIKMVRALVFDVLELNGVPVRRVFSTLSEKLASQLMALYDAGIIPEHVVEIVWHPRDYATEYEVRVL